MSPETALVEGNRGMHARTALGIATAVASTAAMAAGANGASTSSLPTATSGSAVQLVAVGLQTPTSFAFGDGAVFEGDAGSATSSGTPTGGVFLLKDGAATLIPGSPPFVAGLAWHNGALYVSGGNPQATKNGTWHLFRWSGWNGTGFTEQKVIYTPPQSFDGFNGLAFGPNGRLYVGVDTGNTDGNDHGPASKSKYLYDILSLSSTGKDLKVFATGMRQPWQMVFPPGSAFPLVSDLGQDKAATNPPDFVLKVQPGDDFGFPQCNWTEASSCTGFAKPFAQLAPHTDPMGLGVLGSRLYLTSYLGQSANGPGGVVYSMPLKGGTLTTRVSGFVAAIVGLGQHDGWLYIGELNGQVFRWKP
jgi:glucose/arabinose dehydrogenase